MKESIGNAFVFGFFITFAFLLMLMLSAAINYSRANKIKNKILNHIASVAELQGTNNGEILDTDTLSKIVEEDLAKIGYRANDGGWKQNNCKVRNGVESINTQSNYHYCVYAFPTEKGYYYGVATFMYFDIPVIGTTLEFPVYGETRVIYDLTSIDEKGKD